MSTAIDTSLELEPIEARICQLLDDTCQWIRSAHPVLPPELEPAPDADGKRPPSAAETLASNGWVCEARIAGGWVRDKLLHLSSDDMDVSLSTLTGFHFAHYLKLYLDSDAFRQSPLCAELASLPGNKERSGAMGTISKIEANPEQSKNLETATVGVLGRSLDFVNLRKETYLKGSRIPIQEFGTPVEDAERRDCTINSLFYNVHTRRVEDMTGTGLSDLAAGVIRTPLEPFQTFDDDPLRILRAIRFASRFSFRVHEDIRDIFHGPRGDVLRHELASKISRERFGIETDKMLRGPHPALSLELMLSLNLFPVVFRPPPEADGSPSPLYLASDKKTPVPPLRSDDAAVQLGRTLDNMWRQATSREAGAVSSRQAPLFDAEQRRRLFYAAALWPLAGLVAFNHVPDPRPGQKVPKRALIPATDGVLLDGLKVGVKLTKEPVDALFKALAALAEFKSFETAANERGEKTETMQTELFFLLRKPFFINDAYNLSPAAAFLFAALAHTHAGPSDALAHPADLDRWWGWVEDLRMVQRASERPLLNGVQVQELVGFAPGPLIPKIQHQVLQWQLWNVAPDAAHGPTPGAVAAAATWFRQAWDAGAVIPADEVERARAAAASKGSKKKKPKA